ncbi:MAG TPA: hypothetical protein VFR75_08570 [Solirubrobacterales bacterium]|nr:hypothetical protein [Solirubrobacterales bacterium]
MPTYTSWYVTVILEVAGKEKGVQGPVRDTEAEVKADLKELQEQMGSGEWINLDWISANPAHVVAAHVDSSSIGFF